MLKPFQSAGVRLALLLLWGLVGLPAAAQTTVAPITLSNNTGDASAEWIIQGERTLILNGFDTGPTNVPKPYTINAVTLAVTQPAVGIPVGVVVYEDPNGGSPVDARRIALHETIINTTGVVRIDLPQPPTTESQIFWAGFYLPPSFAFQSDQGGASVLTYWGWTPGQDFNLNDLSTAAIFGPSNGSAPVNIDLGGVARINAVITPPVAQTGGFTPQTAPLGRQIAGDPATNLSPMTPYAFCSTLLYDSQDIDLTASSRFRLDCRADVLQDIPGLLGTGFFENAGSLAPGIRTFTKGGYVFDIFTGNRGAEDANTVDGSVTRLTTPVTHCLQPAPEHLERAVFAVAYGAPKRWFILPTLRIGSTICAEITNTGLVTYLLPVTQDQADIPLSANIYFTQTPFIADLGPTGCNQLNSIVAAVRIDGFEAPASFDIAISVVHRRTGNVEQSFFDRVENLAPGATAQINIDWRLPTEFPRESYRVNLVIDPTSAIPELNEGDNTISFDFTLLPTAQCGKKPA